jgi:peptide/nickel transport system ATP-binding protein/oligopeptide transport system ATP-binding protein
LRATGCGKDATSLSVMGAGGQPARHGRGEAILFEGRDPLGLSADERAAARRQDVDDLQSR